jgi:hypothetical protein
MGQDPLAAGSPPPVSPVPPAPQALAPAGDETAATTPGRDRGTP